MRSPRAREVAAALRGAASGLEEDAVDGQSNVSASSTVATTTSLTSRLAALTLDLEDAARKERDCEELGTFPEEEEEEEEEEVVIEVSEADALRILDSQEDPFQVCSRLFHKKVSNPMCLKRLNITHVEEFKQHGYLVLDNFLSKESAAAIRSETLRLRQQGRLTDASKLGTAGFQDSGARGDSILWLHMGRPPMDTPIFGSLAVALQELQEDLQEFVKLQSQAVEYQLACYPNTGASYKKHRDAFPDDGSEQQLRRITAIVYMNPDWKGVDGGALRLWPPRKMNRVNNAPDIDQRHRMMEQLGSEAHQSHHAGAHPNNHFSSTGGHRQPYGVTNGHRQSDPYHTRNLHESPRHPLYDAPPNSEPDTYISDPSECGSLRSDGIDQAIYVPKSTTSSVMAEVGIHDGVYDVSSVDDLSVASKDHDSAKTGIEWVEVSGYMVLEVMPQAGRLVLFLSGAVDHSVNAAHSDRVAVTAWFR